MKQPCEIEDRIKSIMVEILEIKPEDINDVSSPRTIEAWKGYNHRKIIEELEAEFHLSFDRSERDTFVSFKIIKSTIKAYLD